MRNTILLFLSLLIALTGCTVRGGWPRFLRPGEAPGWHAPTAYEIPATNGLSATERRIAKAKQDANNDALGMYLEENALRCIALDITQ